MKTATKVFQALAGLTVTLTALYYIVSDTITRWHGDVPNTTTELLAAIYFIGFAIIFTRKEP